MDFVFRDRKEETFLAGSIPGDKAVRKVGYYSDAKLRALADNERHHVSSGIYPLNLPSRDESKIVAVPCIVFDDVGKIPPSGTIPINGNVEIDELEFAFLPEPTWRTETSLGCYQYGYGFEPMLPPAIARLLHAKLKLHPILGKGLHSLGHYFRLPSGSNTKPGRGNFRTRLTSVGPLYTLNEFLAGFGITLDPVSTVKAATVTGNEQVSVATLRELLPLLPNKDLHYDDWIDMGIIIFGASGGSEEGRELWWEYSQESGKYTEGKTQHAWDSFFSGDIMASASTLRRRIEDKYGRDSDEYRKAAARIAFDEENSPPMEEPKPKPEPKLGTVLVGKTFKLPNPKTIPPRDWLYGRVYIRKFVSGMIAPGGVGKTSLALVEALAMVTGKPLLGLAPRKPLKVAVWNGEDPREEIDRRIAAICIHYGITDADIGDRLTVHTSREVTDEQDRLIIARLEPNGLVVQVPVVKKVIKEIKAGDIDVTIIDPFISSHRVSENSNDAIDVVIKQWNLIAENANCGVMLIHHSRKVAPGMERTGEDARGASALRDGVRVLRVANQMDEAFAIKNGVGKGWRSIFRMTDDKRSMSPARLDDDWFKLVSVGLGNGNPFPADGFAPIDEDEVGVIETWTPPAAGAGLQPAQIGQCQVEISKGAYRFNSQSGDWVGKVIGRVLDIDVGLDGVGKIKVMRELSPVEASGRARVRGLVDTWIKEGWLKVVKKPDVDRDIREFVEVDVLWKEEDKTQTETETQTPDEGG
jgi:hypothetical protein